MSVTEWGEWLSTLLLSLQKNMIKNVLPFFLDGGIQEVTQNTDWNGTSSFVEITSAATLDVGVKSPSGDPVKPGTMLVVTNRSSDNASVDPDADFASGDDAISINDSGASVLLLFKGPSESNTLGEWVVLSKFQADTDTTLDPDLYATLAGATFSGAVTFEDNVQIDGNVGFYGTAPQAQEEIANIADTANATAADVGDKVNELLTSLKELGLLGTPA